ncbi:unnamed protein product, partial [Durusdinium trenchii]
MASIAEADIDLNQNAFLLIHGWTVGPLLLEFTGRLLETCRTAKTVSQVASETEAHEGPLAITLRSCSALGFLKFNPSDATYVVAEAAELEELEEVFASKGEQLWSIYRDSQAPFKIPSEQCTRCLELWEAMCSETTMSKSLGLLLKGIALSPLLTSITYHARWNEQGLDLGRQEFPLDFRAFSGEAFLLKTLGRIFQELGIGQVQSTGEVTVSPRGYLGLQRVYSYYVPSSYAPLLSRFPHVLFENPAWGFNAEAEEEDSEIHVDRTLNVVGSGAQHTTLFKDLLGHVNQVFDNEKFTEQPDFVIDTGCGDGHLLQCIYEHVRDHTPRGKVLEEHPLVMVGVDFNEKSRIATACNLEKHQVPHRVIAGDIGKPSALIAQLKRKKVNPKKCLHVRSFLDHDRPYIPARDPILPESALAAFVRAQLADFVHLDKEGAPIAPLELFASLVEHMMRWGDAMEGSFGLCMLEVMQLDVPTTRRYLKECVSFHFDIVQCLSRQYMVSAVAFALSCAMAGLFPTDCRAVQTYPEAGGYCRMMNQHLVRKPYRIRLAEVSDLPALEKLEQKAWAPSLQASAEVLRQRLERSFANFLCELDGEVVAVLYTQRIASVDAVDSQKFMEISASHDPHGAVLQLIAISADPDIAPQHMGLGS